jgi:hypothetical protein
MNLADFVPVNPPATDTKFADHDVQPAVQDSEEYAGSSAFS